MKLAKKQIFYIFLFALLFKPLWIFEIDNINTQDDLSYWLHGATLAIDFDIDYQNDYKLNSSIFHPSTNTPFHPPGAGYASAPFIYIFEKLDKLSGNQFERVNPVGSFAYLGYFLSSLFYCLCGLSLLSKIIQKNNINNYQLLYFITFLSSLVHFVTTRFLMSHSFEFFLCSYLIYCFETTENFYDFKSFNKIIFLYFALSLTRPSTFIFSLCLIGYYSEKFQFTKLISNFQIYSIFFFGTVYVFLSNFLYEDNFILLNLSNNSTTSEFVSDFTLSNYFIGLSKVVNLIFSFSMGLIWTMPTIIFSIFIVFYFWKKRDISTKKIFFIFLYYFGAFSVLFIWQGREIAYGQRLLIGLLPLSFLIISKFEVKSVLIQKFYFVFLFIHYLYFYSPNLTLVEGRNLWGIVTKFSPTNYTFNLLINLFQYENILYILLKNIYSINFINLFNYEVVFKLPFVEKLITQGNQIEKLRNTLFEYSNIDAFYLIIVNLFIFLFCFGLIKISSR